MRFIIVCCIALLLSACASMPASRKALNQNLTWKAREAKVMKMHQWRVSGSIGARSGQTGFGANYVWEQRGDHYAINLYGPLGAGGAMIQGRPGHITLRTSKGRRYVSNSPEQLTQQHLGYRLPISNLRFWARGLPGPGGLSHPQFDKYHHLRQFTQSGWTVTYQSYTAARGLDLPSLMTLFGPGKTRVRLVMSSWNH